MPTLSAALNAYLDMNFLLVVVCGLWVVLRSLLRLAGQGHSVTAQLHVLRLGIVLVVLSPILALAAAYVAQSGVVGTPFNLTDFLLAQYLQGRIDMPPETVESMLNLRATTAAALGAPAGTIGVAVLAVLGAGFAICLVRLGMSFAKLRRIIAGSFVWRRFGSVELRLSDTVTVPFSTLGLRRNIIVLPTTILSEMGDLKIALGHELQHLRQRDVIWEVAVEFLKPLFFWNPAFHIWKHQVEDLRELSCDRQVLARRRYDVEAYCRCLLRVCHNSLHRRPMFAIEVPVVALVQTESRLFGPRSAQQLRRRMVSAIEGRVERRPNSLALALTAPLLVLSFLALVAIQRPGDWSQDRLMLSTIINLERIHAINATPSFGQPSW
jgi:beta-lactamase regulating signal transducer with metallopeptidase domain